MHQVRAPGADVTPRPEASRPFVGRNLRTFVLTTGEFEVSRMARPLRRMILERGRCHEFDD